MSVVTCTSCWQPLCSLAVLVSLDTSTDCVFITMEWVWKLGSVIGFPWSVLVCVIHILCISVWIFQSANQSMQIATKNLSSETFLMNFWSLGLHYFQQVLMFSCLGARSNKYELYGTSRQYYSAYPCLLFFPLSLPPFIERDEFDL